MVRAPDHFPMPGPDPEQEPRFFFRLATVSDETVVNPILTISEMQLIALKGLPLLVWDFQTFEDKRAGIQKPVAEVRVADIVQSLHLAEEAEAEQRWAEYLQNATETNPAYSSGGIAEAVGPTLDFLIAHGTLEER